MLIAGAWKHRPDCDLQQLSVMLSITATRLARMFPPSTRIVEVWSWPDTHPSWKLDGFSLRPCGCCVTIQIRTISKRMREIVPLRRRGHSCSVGITTWFDIVRSKIKWLTRPTTTLQMARWTGLTGAFGVPSSYEVSRLCVSIQRTKTSRSPPRGVSIPFLELVGERILRFEGS